MKYKAFQDFYNEQSIKHLILHDHNGVLVSPPFSTEACRDYNKFMVIDNDVSYIDLDLPDATSKFNAITSINDSIWCIPYGIWDNFNVVLEIKNFKPIYHYIDMPGKGQFYSVASNKKTAFSFPLGYNETSYGLYIKNNKVSTIEFDRNDHIKLHMGTVYCNGKYWSPPRGDTSNYINLMSFDGEKLESYPIDVKNQKNTRKYTDLIVNENILYALPFGEHSGMNEILEFNTNNNTYNLYDIGNLDFAKKYNCMVMLGDNIIGMPYGDEHLNDSNWGICFNIKNKISSFFNIGNELSFGGKYRFRCGINYNETAVFFPSGTPQCPILQINKDLKVKSIYIQDIMLGRPIIHQNKLKTLGYNLIKKTNSLFVFEEDLSYTESFLK